MSSFSNSNSSIAEPTASPSTNLFESAGLVDIFGSREIFDQQPDYVQRRLREIACLKQYLARKIQKLNAMPRLPPGFQMNLKSEDEELWEQWGLNKEIKVLRGILVAKLTLQKDPYSAFHFLDMEFDIEEQYDIFRPLIEPPEELWSRASCAYQAYLTPSSPLTVEHDGKTNPLPVLGIQDITKSNLKTLTQSLHYMRWMLNQSKNHFMHMLADHPEVLDEESTPITGFAELEAALSAVDSMSNDIGRFYRGEPEDVFGAEQERMVDAFMERLWNSS